MITELANSSRSNPNFRSIIKAVPKLSPCVFPKIFSKLFNIAYLLIYVRYVSIHSIRTYCMSK